MPPGIVCSRMDRRLLDLLAAERGTLATLLDLVHVGVSIAHDRACSVVSLNRWFAERLAGDPEQNFTKSLPNPAGARFRLLRDGVEIPAADLPLQRAAALGERVTGFECEVEVVGRPPFRLVINAAPLLDDAGGVRGAIAIHFDITDRARIEAALRESEALHRLLVDAANDAIVLADADSGLILDVNRRAEQLFGLPAADLRGRHQSDLHPPEDAARYRTDFRRHVEQGSGIMTDVWVRHASGRRVHVEISGNVLTLGGRSVIQGIFRDLSERDAMLAQLRESREELERFASVAAHDLQEPLRTMSSFADLLVRRLGPRLEDREGEWLGHIATGAHRMQRMVRALLDYARAGGSAEEEDVHLGAALDEVREALGTQVAATGAVLEADALPVVRGVRTQLMQLLQNLVGNALKYAGPSPRVRVAAREEADRWVIEIVDNGPGIPAADRERLFEPFTRGRTDVPGTGLGLATCRRIVLRHGGRISAHDAPQGGALLRVELPKR